MRAGNEKENLSRMRTNITGKRLDHALERSGKQPISGRMTHLIYALLFERLTDVIDAFLLQNWNDISNVGGIKGKVVILRVQNRMFPRLCVRFVAGLHEVPE
jgi:hypothetical protein